MPDIKLPYTPKGEELVENIKEEVEEVGGDIDYAPGGAQDASMRSTTTYAGGGKTGYNIPQPEVKGKPLNFARTDVPKYEEGEKVPEYKKGGSVERKARRQERREARQERRNVRKINKLALKKGLDKVKIGKNYDPAKGKPTGKIRPKAKEVTLTEGGAYATYEKKSAPAKSFRKSFSAARKAGKKTFTWDGRSYTTKVK